ncbi:DsbA family protein, partial [Acinetobacter baumannii]|uniref:DsbA family protein n=1 Tax=Acinetobacter baumannii TaxID=470 RepID=UPI00189B0B5C
INPMGKVCYQAEKAITEFADERSEKVSLRFIPYLSFKSISDQFYKENKRLMNLEERNDLYITAYQASLAFYAASMQGKKFGRTFLMLLQKYVLDDNVEVTSNLFADIAKELKLDMDMFLEDRKSQCAINMYNS